MIFVETRIFTRRVKELLDDDTYAAFQKQLVVSPSIGDVIEARAGSAKPESQRKDTASEAEHG